MLLTFLKRIRYIQKKLLLNVLNGFQVRSQIINETLVPMVANAVATLTLVRKEIIISGFSSKIIFLSCASFAIKLSILIELFQFLRQRKKLWLAPIIFTLVILGGLLILAQGSVIAPFIYTLF